MVNNVGTVKLSKDSLKLIKKIASAGLSGDLERAILRKWDRRAAIIAGAASVKAGKSKRVRSGLLRQSIVGAAEQYKGLPAVRVGILRGPALRYAGVQEFGTKPFNPDSPYDTIVPKKAKALAFAPDGSPALTPAGVARFGGPRDYPGELSFVPFRGPNAIGGLYDKEELEGLEAGQSLRDFQAVYILIRRMDIKPGYFLRDSMKEGIPKLLQDAADIIVQVFQRGAAR